MCCWAYSRVKVACAPSPVMLLPPRTACSRLLSVSMPTTVQRFPLRTWSALLPSGRVTGMVASLSRVKMMSPTLTC